MYLVYLLREFAILCAISSVKTHPTASGFIARIVIIWQFINKKLTNNSCASIVGNRCPKIKSVMVVITMA